MPGCVDAWWELHQRYGKLPWKELFDPAIAYAEEGAPVAQTVAYYIDASLKRFTTPGLGIEEVENFRKIWAPERQARRAKARCSATLPSRARSGSSPNGGRDAFYKGEIADTIERYFKRIGGWMTKADLAAHTSEWTQPIVTNYRGVDVYGLAPNTQGLTTLQMLNIMEQFDLKSMGFQSPALIHHCVEAKRLAFEDRARYFADPDFVKTPIEWLNSKDYARERAKLIKPNAHSHAGACGRGAEPRRHHLLLHGGS